MPKTFKVIPAELYPKFLEFLNLYGSGESMSDGSKNTNDSTTQKAVKSIERSENIPVRGINIPKLQDTLVPSNNTTSSNPCQILSLEKNWVYFEDIFKNV